VLRLSPFIRWEQWVLRVVVNNTPRPITNDSASVIERQRTQDTAEGMLRNGLLKIFELVGGPMDHVPPCQYEFDISCSKRADDRENVYSRVTNMPPILNLTN
jgi:Autophagy-related protein 101